MMRKYKCFWFEIYEEGLTTIEYVTNIFYNGTCANVVSHPDENTSIVMAKDWVDSEGFEWLGYE